MTEELYKKVSSRIEADWYPYHEEEWFTHTDICMFFDWKDQETRKQVSKKLYYDNSKGVNVLEKRGKGYRIVDRSVEELDWLTADVNAVYKLALPFGIFDKTHFAFEENITIPPKGIVLVAGVSNEGKTAFCLNMLVDNMDTYKCTYFTNEYTEIGFKRRMEPFTDWCELTNEEGKPKFRAILRYDNYHDVIDPDGFNIIDYLDVNDEAEYYKLVPYIKRIQKALKKGIAVIALQKPPNRPDAFGGSNLRGAASLYVTIDKGKLRVLKAKDWVKDNPNGKVYAFGLTHGGNVFTDIHEVYEDGA